MTEILEVRYAENAVFVHKFKKKTTYCSCKLFRTSCSGGLFQDDFPVQLGDLQVPAVHFHLVYERCVNRWGDEHLPAFTLTYPLTKLGTFFEWMIFPFAVLLGYVIVSPEGILVTPSCVYILNVKGDVEGTSKKIEIVVHRMK